MVKGGLNHESREINEVFHDSHKFFEGFMFHVKSVRDGMIIDRAVGTICNNRMLLSQVPESVASKV